MIDDKLIDKLNNIQVLDSIYSSIIYRCLDPLSVISVLISGLSLRVDFDDIESNEIKEHLDKISSELKILKDILYDYHEFKMNNNLIQFTNNDIKRMITSLIGANLSKNFIEIISNETDITFYSYFNSVVLISIIIIQNSVEAFLGKDINNKFIELKFNKDEDYIYLDFIDNAGGINDDILDDVFKPYFTTKDNSLGIGLFQAKSLIENELDGDIHISNVETKKGKGTKVSLKLLNLNK